MWKSPNRVWLCAMGFGCVIAVIAVLARISDHGPVVSTSRLTGSVLSMTSGRGGYLTVKLQDTDRTIVVASGQLLYLPAGTIVPIDRREYKDGTVMFSIAEIR